jgi:formiminotetrahydrofolate cyclodeaminase
VRKPRLTAEQKARRRRANQVPFWNAKQAAAQTPQDRAGVWHDACRMRAVEAENTGDNSVWEELASHLHDFFVAHSR